MEAVVDLQVVSEDQGRQENRIWSEDMEQQAVENANDGEPQENSLIAPLQDDEVPDAIGKMMNNGIKFARLAGPWKVE